MKARYFLLGLVLLAIMIVVPACDNLNSPTTNNLEVLEDDYCGKTVIVIMTQDTGGVNKVHEKDFFGEIANQIVEIEDLTWRFDPEKVDLEQFHQILNIKLDKDDKANMIIVVDYLNTIEGIKLATPSYNDPHARRIK